MTDEVIKLAATYFKVDGDTLKPGDDLFETLGIDSMQALDLLTELEMEFDVEIPDYEVRDVKTFEELAQLIARRR